MLLRLCAPSAIFGHRVYLHTCAIISKTTYCACDARKPNGFPLLISGLGRCLRYFSNVYIVHAVVKCMRVLMFVSRLLSVCSHWQPAGHFTACMHVQLEQFHAFVNARYVKLSCMWSCLLLARVFVDNINKWRHKKNAWFFNFYRLLKVLPKTAKILQKKNTQRPIILFITFLLLCLYLCRTT